MNSFDEFKEHIQQLIEKMQYEARFQRSCIYGEFGGLVWEEPEDEYQKRLLEMGSEYVKYLKQKKQTMIEKFDKEVEELSALIYKAENYKHEQ